MNKALTKQTLKIFWQHGQTYGWQAIFLFVGMLFVALIQSYTPLVYRDLINLLAGGPTESVVKGALWLVATILLLNTARLSVWRTVDFVNNRFQPRVMADVTNSCYQYLQKHSYTFFNGNFVGSLVTRVKRFERSFEQIADQVLFELGRSFLDTILILGLLLWQYPTFGIIVLVWAVLYLLFSYFFSLYKMPVDIARAHADTRTTGQLADSITNNSNIKLFTGYEKENKRFFDVTNIQFLLRKKSWDLDTWSNLVQGLMTVALECVVMFLAVRHWQQGLLFVGDVALLQGVILRMADKLWGTGKQIRKIYEAIADANEMTEMLVKPHEVDDKKDAKKIKVKEGAVSFNNVTFGYHAEKKVLKNFTLTIPTGQRMAFVGPSGGGKTTITKLLFRFLDIQKGTIFIDGQNIADVTQDSLRANLSLVPQEPILFHRTLMENIRYAKPNATEAEVVQAAKAAHCHEFISTFPEKYETFVGERGIKLSGGERQRVAIARAILKNAPILVLDEATSSLDSESEKYIQDALRTLMKGKTTIVIAHRLSTIMQMDRIVVIEKGSITEDGKHEELVKAQAGTYQRLWEIQAGGFAAA